MMRLFTLAVFCWMLGGDAPPVKAQFNQRGDVMGLRFSPDGKTLAAFDGGRLFLTDVTTGRSLGSLTGTGQDVRGVAVSPDGRLAACTNSASIEVWDIASGSLVHYLSKPSGYFFDVAFSPDGHTLAAAGESQMREEDEGTFVGVGVTSHVDVGEVRLWDVQTGRTKGVFRGDENGYRGAFNILFSLAWAPDGKTIAVGGTYSDHGSHFLHGGAVELWDSTSGTIQGALPCDLANVEKVRFAPDGKSLAAGGGGGPLTALVWDLQTRKVTARIQLPVKIPENLDDRWVSSMTFSPDGTQLALGVFGRQAHIWKLAERAWQSGLGEKTRGARVLAFTRDSRQLLLEMADDSVIAYDPETGVPMRTVVSAQQCAGGSAASYLAFTPDEKTLITGSRGGFINVRDAATGTLRWTGDIYKTGNYAGLTTAFSPDGQTLAGADCDGRIAVWNVAQRRRKFSIVHENAIFHEPPLAFSPPDATGRALLASGNSHFELTQPPELVNGVRQGRRSGTVKLWDAATGSQLSELPALDEPVGALAFTNSGHTLLVAGSYNMMGLWDIEAKDWRWKIDKDAGTTNFSISSDGNFLAAARYKGMDWRSPRTGELLRHIPFPKVGKYFGLCNVAVSCDGSILLAFSYEYGESGKGPMQLEVWDTRTGKMLASRPSEHGVRTLCASPVHPHLFAVGEQFGAMRLYNVLAEPHATLLQPVWVKAARYSGTLRN